MFQVIYVILNPAVLGPHGGSVARSIYAQVFRVSKSQFGIAIAWFSSDAGIRLKDSTRRDEAIRIFWKRTHDLKRANRLNKRDAEPLALSH
jgi:hypothetical protein